MQVGENNLSTLNSTKIVGTDEGVSSELSVQRSTEESASGCRCRESIHSASKKTFRLVLTVMERLTGNFKVHAPSWIDEVMVYLKNIPQCVQRQFTTAGTKTELPSRHPRATNMTITNTPFIAFTTLLAKFAVFVSPKVTEAIIVSNSCFYTGSPQK